MDWKTDWDNWKPHTVPQIGADSRVLAICVVVGLVILALAGRYL